MKALYALALVATLAQAQQGAELLSAVKAQTPAQQAWLAEQSKRPEVERITLVTIDARALDSNVISVRIDNQVHRFTLRSREKTSAENEAWYAAGTPDTSAVFSRSNGAVTSGDIRVRGEHYRLVPGALIKVRPTPVGKFIEAKPERGQK